MRRFIIAVAGVVVLAVVLTGLGQLSTASAEEGPTVKGDCPDCTIFVQGFVVGELEENLAEEVGPSFIAGDVSPDFAVGAVGPGFIIGVVEDGVPEAIP